MNDPVELIRAAVEPFCHPCADRDAAEAAAAALKANPAAFDYLLEPIQTAVTPDGRHIENRIVRFFRISDSTWTPDHPRG
jgi:hypothetical protein